PPEMPRPLMPSGVEEPRSLVSLGINTPEVRALVVITGKARESQVARDRLAAMLLCDDVIDLEGRGRELLGKPAVFAAAAASSPDQFLEGVIHAGHEADVRS